MALAHRALLLLSFLLLHLGGVWGQTIWENDGSLGNVNWGNGAMYRFALDGTDNNNEACCTFPIDVWERIKSETLYVIIKGTNPQIRVTSGHWQNQWGGDIFSGNNLLKNNGDGTFTLEVTLAGASLLDVIDVQHLLFTGQNYSVEKLYLLDPYVGALPSESNRFNKTQTVSRSIKSVDVSLKNESQLTTPKYARFYLTNIKDEPVNPVGKLTVKYGDDDAMPCTITKKGVYLYLGAEPNQNTIDKSKISVQLVAPKAYKLYKVVCLFSNSAPEMDKEKISQEPDFNQQYTYSFNYRITTQEVNDDVNWRDGMLMPNVAYSNPDNDWDISWEELSLGYCVKWYVLDESDNRVTLENGTSRTSNWAIDANAKGYTVSNNEAIWNGSDDNVTADIWDAKKNPTFYVPTDKEYANVNGYKIVCEIYTNSNPTDKDKPNARYTFSVRDFLGDLKPEGGTTDGRSEEIKKGVTSLEMDLDKVSFPGDTPAKYARIWLTTTDGTLVDPTGKLLIEGMIPYVTEGKTDVRYGYYLTGENISLATIKSILQLPLATYTQYQVHVAFSTDPPIIGNGEIIHEPNYDYVYTLSFAYPVKTKYKTLIYDNNRQCKPILLKNWMEVAGDCGEGITNLNNNLYVRWYLATISVVDGKEVETPINISDGWKLEGGNGYTYNSNVLGYEKKGGFGLVSGGFKNNNNNHVIPTITLPSRDNYNDVRLICVATTKDNSEEIQVKYVYTLRTSGSLNKFAHYEGEAYRYLKEIGYDDQAKDYDYLTTEKDKNIVSGNALTWNSEENDYNADNKNVRQNVHTVDYYFYVKIDEPQSLLLPLQFYKFDGQETEPMAYYRWYDYKTDASSARLTTISNNTKLKNIDNRGWFAINELQSAPRESFVGVNFTASQADFDKEGGEFLIACDVSRYFDGMDESFTHFVHEPTLSIRYLFHVMPASKIAGDIAKAGSLTNVENQIKEGKKPKDILEDEGRIVVSTNKGVGKFSLRTRLSDITQYYVNDNTQANSLWWYVYYKDANDIWWRHLIENPDNLIEVYESGFNGDGKTDQIKYVPRATMYQGKYSLNGDINGKGDWTPLTGTGGTTPTVGVGDCVQMVGCVSTGLTGNADKPSDINNVTPIIWAELEFIDAMPLMLGTEKNNKERTAAYMAEHYGEPTVLNFNDFSLLGQRMPTHSYENYATVPLLYKNAQYGFSYPQLYGLCATSWYCSWDGYGIDPMHGDYLLLKSMGMTNVSANETWEQGIWSNWWYSHDGGGVQYLPDHTVLLDVTHEREHPTDKLTPNNPTDSEDYGGFLYVDAADEARTIASLEFTDSLCADAKIYYTAYIASVCGRNYPRGWAQTPPMLRFRVTTWDDEQQKDVPVVTFVTGDIKEEINLCKCYNCKCTDDDSYRDGCSCGNNCNHTFKNAHWYQVYGYTTIPSELNYLLDGSPRTYRVEIDNYCDNTDGADYCVDEISFYRNNAKLNVMQSAKKDCDDKGVALNIYVSDKDLQYNGMAGGTIYWRFCDGNGNPVVDEKLYGDNCLIDKKDGTPYGYIEVPQEYKTDTLKLASEFIHPYGYFKMESNGQTEYYFSLANTLFELTEGMDYHISVFKMGKDMKPDKYIDDPDYDTYWGKLKNACSAYSPIFVPKMMYVSVSGLDGNSNPSIKVSCPTHKVIDTEFEIMLNIPDDDSGLQSYPNVNFDYYIGTKENLQAERYGEGDVKFSLEDAVKLYRNYKGGNENTITWDTLYVGLDPTFQTVHPTYYKVLEDSVKAGVLHLSCSSKVKLTIDADHATLWALATDERHEGHLVCTPLPLVFNLVDELEDPYIMLGFSKVDYGDNHRRVVRVGLEQLDKMRDDDDGKGFLLHIPVNSFKAKKPKDNAEGDVKENVEDTEGTVVVAEEQPKPKEALGITSGYLKLLANGTNDPTITSDINVATFEGTVIDKDIMYIAFNFHGEALEDSRARLDTLFHEGFTYRMFFQVKNNAKLQDPAACKADVEFLMKVVPKYVTWNDTSSNKNQNKNWNNDANWSRSGREELYKKDGHNSDNYKDNAEIFRDYYEEGDSVPLPSTFVPMAFTYVTIPSKSRAPKLVNLSRGTGKYDIYTNVDNVEGYGDDANFATDSIEYDLMVCYMQERCLGHEKLEDGMSDPIEGNIYDCERFYGNVCKQIYFKPGAELINQQFLTYGKAWVEKTLTANKWYLMSTPLKNTYAGDMYVPSVDGQQTTEAFRDIMFNTPTYSRTAYPIYQRSWGTAFGSKVYVKDNPSYDAGLGYNTVTTMAEWGHTFNDVEVPYTERTAFAIRAHKKEQTVDALLRLPKDDTSYSYYGYNGSAQGSPVTVRGNGEATGRFITDATTPAADAAVTISTSNLQQQGGYILVGNPYVASLNMSEFFSVNSEILTEPSAYYTYGYDDVNGVYEAKTHTGGFIRPLEAFFVKVKESTNPVDIKFTSAMMMDGNSVDNNNTMPAPALTLTASNGRGQSSATLSVGEEAKSVETLFDSNLDDVPMVYTVADGQAVSINQLTELRQPIAFGVTCMASDELVEVTFTDVEQLTNGNIYVVDAVTGSQTTISEGSTLTIQPNDYGRYFLLAGTTGIGDTSTLQKGIMVRVRGSEVTVSSSEELTLVRALSLGGAPVYQDSSRSTTASFTLSSGVYIIQAENVAGEQQTVKVVIR